MDDRYRHPAVGTVALMVDGERELRIGSLDSGHELYVMLCDNYRPTLAPGPNSSGDALSIRLRKPYTVQKLVDALKELGACQ